MGIPGLLTEFLENRENLRVLIRHISRAKVSNFKAPEHTAHALTHSPF